MDERKYKEARKRVKAKQEFYRHFATYVVMSAFFFLLNAVTAFGNWWFIWPMLGWGLAVVFHYVDVFGIPGFDPMSAEWEEEQIQKEMRRLDSQGKGQASTDTVDELDLRPLDKRPEEPPRKMPERRWDDSELV